MPKPKNKSKSKAKAQSAKKLKGVSKAPPVNPFEIRKQKLKQQVLNSKTRGSTLEVGKSRSEANARRDQTLGIEYQRKGVNNEFIDRRFTGIDENLSPEEKGLIMYQRQKQKAWDASSFADLGEEEALTHLGQTLDLQLFDEEDKEKDEFYEEEFAFGGMKRVGGENGEEGDGHRKTKEEVMKEIIAKSKKMRNIAKTIRKEDEEAVMTLDSGFDELRDLLGPQRSKEQKSKPFRKEGKDEVDEEDEDVKPKKSKERTKGQEEKALAADGWDDDEIQAIVAKMQRFEKGEDIKAIYASTDSTGEAVTKPALFTPVQEDDFDRMARELALEPRAAPSNPLRTDEDIALASIKRLQQLEEARLRRMRGEEDDHNDEERHRESADVVAPKKQKQYHGRQGGADDLDDGFDIDIKRRKGSESSDDESGSEEPGSGSDSGSDSDNEEKAKKEKKSFVLTTGPEITSLSPTEELPFTFVLPSSYKIFSKIISNQSLQRQILIIKRIRACNHISLSEKNKDKMKTFYQYIIERILELGTLVPVPMDQLDLMTFVAYELSHEMPSHAAGTTRKYIIKLQEAGGEMPSISDLIFLALILRVWPVSDQRHVVVTPTLLYMSAVLSKVQIQKLEDVVKGLFLANLIITITKSGGRFSSEPLSLLISILNSFSTTQKEDLVSFSRPATLASFNSSVLQFKKMPSDGVPLILNFSSMVQQKPKEEEICKLSILSTTLKMLSNYLRVFTENDKQIDGILPLLHSVQGIVSSLPKNLPRNVQGDANVVANLVLNTIRERKGKLKPLNLIPVQQASVPKMLEPDFESVYTGKKKNKHLGDKEREDARLKHLFKQERKGAEREIRLDAQYLARKKEQKTRDMDADRTQKTKKLMGMLETQQHNANVVQKQKKQKTSAF